MNRLCIALLLIAGTLTPVAGEVVVTQKEDRLSTWITDDCPVVGSAPVCGIRQTIRYQDGGEEMWARATVRIESGIPTINFEVTYAARDGRRLVIFLHDRHRAAMPLNCSSGICVAQWRLDEAHIARMCAREPIVAEVLLEPEKPTRMLFQTMQFENMYAALRRAATN